MGSRMTIMMCVIVWVDNVQVCLRKPSGVLRPEIQGQGGFAHLHKAQMLCCVVCPIVSPKLKTSVRSGHWLGFGGVAACHYVLWLSVFQYEMHFVLTDWEPIVAESKATKERKKKAKVLKKKFAELQGLVHCNHIWLSNWMILLTFALRPSDLKDGATFQNLFFNFVAMEYAGGQWKLQQDTRKDRDDKIELVFGGRCWPKLPYCCAITNSMTLKCFESGAAGEHGCIGRVTPTGISCHTKQTSGTRNGAVRWSFEAMVPQWCVCVTQTL